MAPRAATTSRAIATGCGIYRKEETTRVPYVRGNKHGRAVTYRFDDERIIKIAHYRDGKLGAKGSFVKGKPDGEWVVHTEGEYGVEAGDQTIVFRRGKLISVDGERADRDQQKYWKREGRLEFAEHPRAISSYHQDSSSEDYP